ncbi:MAG TPA: hypothetical protein VKB61_01975 [Candidatus Acidoferrum sp.]|jgi:hypothetical protein|nr:hypothetical protein [Candidatus Acidoferrum sp.]
MIGTRRKKQNLDYRWFLERLGQEELPEIIALEELVKGSTEDPEAFLEEWLRPLLRQGLSIERAYEVVIESVLRPN